MKHWQLKKQIVRLSKVKAFWFLSAFGLFGVVMLLATFAATYSVSVDPENGAKDGVTQISDSTDPSTKAISFGTIVPVAYSSYANNVGPLASELNVASNASWSWNAPISTTGADQYKVTMRSTSAVTQQGNYFWSSSFVWSNKRDSGGYLGLQTRVAPLSARGAIFSIWNATVAEAAPSGIAKPFGGEGIGMQTAILLNWFANTDYELSVQRDIGRSTGTYNWWTGTVTDPTTGISSIIGTIQTPAVWGYMIPNNNFLERYGAANTCTAFEPAGGRFRALRASNGGSVSTPKDVRVELREYNDCGGVVTSKSVGDGYEVNINPGVRK